MKETGSSLSARFRGPDGKLRLQISDSGSELVSAHWIQPATGLGGLATPIRFERRGSNRWVGSVAPHSSRVELLLIVERGFAYIRDPNGGLGRRLRRMTVHSAGGRLRLHSPRSGATLSLKLSRDRRSLVLEGSPYGDRLVLSRLPRGRTLASAFAYAPPQALGDGWDVASLDDVEMQHRPIEAFLQRLREDDLSGWKTPQIRGLLIARHGKLVLEAYLHGHRRNELVDIGGAAMGFASAMVGVAIEQGSLDTRVRVFDEDADRVDPARPPIRLAHLLSMQSGLDCDDNEDSTAGHVYSMRRRQKLDWYRETRRLAVIGTPGGAAAYCTAGFNLAGELVGDATGMWIPDAFEAWLARPLGIGRYRFPLMTSGEGFFGSGLYLSLRDFAKVGQLFLEGGTWEGRRVISESWVRAATGPHATIDRPDDFGYGWWRTRYRYIDEEYDAFYASGNGGQLVIVIPSLGLVLATHGAYGDYRTWRRFHDVAVPRHFIAACRG